MPTLHQKDPICKNWLNAFQDLTYDPKEKTITYNGHTIKEITVNGKDFFKGNQQVVLENLPVKFVSQLKVYDKPTKQEEATGMKSAAKKLCARSSD